MTVSFPSRIAAVAVLVLLGSATVASAQTPAEIPWNRGATLELFAGATDASPNTYPTAGAAFGWEVTHFIEVEGLGAWFLKRNGAQAFTADMKLLVNLMRPSRVVPFLGGGMGLYWQSFDPGSTMPPFYAERLIGVPANKPVSFTDPTAVIVGGANLYLARHMSVRPDLTFRFVTDGSGVYRVTTLSLSFIYHFEDHPKE